MRMRIAVVGAVVVAVAALLAAAVPAAATPIGAILILSSIAIFAWAAIGLVSPSKAQISGRAQAIGIWIASIVVLGIGGAIMPEPPPPTAAELAAAEQAEQEREAERLAPADTSSRLTRAQQNAVRSANAYLRMTGFSRQGLIGQLSSDFGDGYDVRDATVAVDSLDVNWNEQAARSADAYLKTMGFSCRGLIEQLSSDAGSQYTMEQATHGATQAGIC